MGGPSHVLGGEQRKKEKETLTGRKKNDQTQGEKK